ncbi:MAG: hypothetical protein ACE5J2_00220 [Nitrososphaerales archaeon]
MSEDRSILYKTRWEILVISAALVLSAVVVLAIPNDFSAKILEQQKEQREASKNPSTVIEEQKGLNEGIAKNMTESNAASMKP